MYIQIKVNPTFMIIYPKRQSVCSPQRFHLTLFKIFIFNKTQNAYIDPWTSVNKIPIFFFLFNHSQGGK